MGKVVMYASVSVDGFIADENDQPGPIFDWLTSGDVPLDDSGVLKVSRASYDHTRPYWDSIGATVVGQVFAAGHVDEVRMDVAPVVLGSGKRFFGSVSGQRQLEDPDVVIAGERVLHLRFPVRR